MQEQELSVAPHRQLLFGILRAALRSEQGVREHHACGKPTGFYAGRRSGFIASAALLMAELYGGNYDEAKKALSEALRATAQGWPDANLRDRPLADDLAVAIAEAALRVI